MVPHTVTFGRACINKQRGSSLAGRAVERRSFELGVNSGRATGSVLVGSLNRLATRTLAGIAEGSEGTAPHQQTGRNGGLFGEGLMAPRLTGFQTVGDATTSY